MAEVPDYFGRVGNFKNADFDSLAESLKSAVGKAVEYAAGKAKSTGDDVKKETDRLVDAMEELGEKIKENLEEVKGFVDQVKKASDGIEKKKSSKATGGDDLAAMAREQTRILQQILRSQQKAVSEKAAKFTSGATALAAPSGRRAGLKDMGFRPRGADKIPAMLSPGEFVVNRRGARGNESLLDGMNRGYFRGGKVKPAYLAEGSLLDRIFGGKGGRAQASKMKAILPGPFDQKTHDEAVAWFKSLGKDVEVQFSNEFDKGIKHSAARWITSITSAFVGHDPFGVLFEGGVKDITEFRREMRSLAFQAEGITGEFRKSQAEFARIGTDIAGRTGVSVTAFQKAYLANARKGFKDQKASMKVLESGLKLSTLIGSEAQATSTLFADWHRDLGLGAGQMERMANNMQTVARRTGMTGDELVGVMKSSEQILKNLRRQGTLTTTASRNIIQTMAEFKKEGFEDVGQKLVGAMSGYSAFQGADEKTKTLLGVAAAQGGVDYRDVMFGRVPQDADKMGKMAEGLKKQMADMIGVRAEDFDFEKLTEAQRETLAIGSEGAFGVQISEVEAAYKSFSKTAAGLGGSLADLEKTRSNQFATPKEKQESEKKINDTLLSASMDLLGSVTANTKDKSLADAAKAIAEGQTKDAIDFKAGTKDLSAMASYMSSATKDQFGLSGTQENMEKQIQMMSAEKQMQLRSMTAAEQLDKTMQAQGKGSKNFAGQMKAALAKGDTTKFNALAEEMGAAFSESQVKDATSVDPMERLNQTMVELNETFRGFMSPLVGGLLDFVGSSGMLAGVVGSMGATLYNMMPWDVIGMLADPEEGIGLMLMEGLEGAFGGQFLSTMGSVLRGAIGPAVLLLGSIKGVMESSEAGRTKTEGAILGAYTGGAKTGSFITGRYGEAATAADKTLGVAGAAAWGASAGAAISLSLGGLDFGAMILAGAIIGAFMEIVKIVTEGTDILQDIVKPIQVVVDYVYEVCKGIYDIFAGLVTLDIGRAFTGLFNIIGSTIMVLPRLIFGVVQMIVIGLPKLILRAIGMLWTIPKAIMDSIKSALAGLVDNAWVGPIFKVLSDAFNAIYDGFMAIWTPISEIFSGLYTVFNDLGKALFGAGKGGGMLSGVMWALQKVVWGLAYVISWLLYPIKLLAQALGFVLKIVGTMIKAIIAPFQYLYEELVGHSIVPDLVFGIIKFFAMLPFRIFKLLATVPFLIGRALLKVPETIANAFLNLGSSLKGFGTDGVFGLVLSQLGVFYTFVGSTISNLVNLAKGIFSVLQGILTLDFGMVWDGIKAIGGTLVAAVKNIGNLLWGLASNSLSFFFKMMKKIPMMILNGLKLAFFEFPRWLVGKLMDGLWALGNFFLFTLPKILWDAFTKSLKSVGKYIYDVITYPFRKLGEWLYAIFVDFPKWLFGKIVGIFGDFGVFAKASLVGLVGWFASSLMGGFGGMISTVTGFFTSLPGIISGGFMSALGGVWSWIKGWIPGLKGLVGGVGGGIAKAGSAALDFGKSLVPSIKDKASAAFDKLGGAANSIKGYASGFFEKGKGMFSSLFEKGKGTFEKGKGMFSSLFERGKGAFEKGKGTFSDIGKKAVGSIKDASSKGKGLLGGIDSASAKGLLSKATSAGTGLLGKVAGGGKGLLSKATSTGTGLLGKVAGGGKGLLSKVISKGTGLFGKFGGAAKGLAGSLSNMITGEGDECRCSGALTKATEEQTSALDVVGEVLTPENIQKGLSSGKGILGKGKDFLGGMLGKGKGLLGDLAGKAGTMFSKGGGLISGLFGKSGVSKAAGGLMSKGAGIMGSLFGGAGKLVGKMGLGGVGKSLLKKIPGIGAIAGAGFAISSLIQGDVGGAITNLASGIASTIPGIGTALSMGIDMFGGTISEGVGWLASKAWDGAKEFGKATGDLVSNVWQGAKSIGSKLAEGASWLYEGAKGLFSNAWSGLTGWVSSWWGGSKEKALASAAGNKIGGGVAAAKPAGAPATAAPVAQKTAGVEPVHLRDVKGQMLRERAGSSVSKLHSDELSRMEESSNKQVGELEQIRQGINELVSLMKPKGSVVGSAGEAQPGRTKDPRRPLHAARFGKMKYGTVGGLANRSYVNNGEY